MIRQTIPVFLASTFLLFSMEVHAQGLAEIANEFTNYDMNSDGIAEVESLKFLSAPSKCLTVEANAKLLLVIVESRLMTNDRTVNDDQNRLLQSLQHYERQLDEDGWHAVVIDAKIHASDRHQDGLSVLAMRRLFKRLRNQFPQFAGAVLVGSFPEAMLVRRWIWKRNDRAVSFGDETFNKKGHPTAEFLSIKPELIAKRSDVVLCDLDGNWEEIYCEGPTNIESITVMPEVAPETKAWPDFSQPFETSRFSLTTITYSDFFFINDSQYQYERLPDGKVRFSASNQMLVPEVGGNDSKLPNPLATPDIMVSRINALHVAVNLPADHLDDSGRPKATEVAKGSPERQFFRDAAFELRLLRDYFDRNFSHRSGQTPVDARRVALLTTDLQTPSPTYFASTSKQLGAKIVRFPQSTAVSFAEFLQAPALVKGVSAHSDASCSVLIPGYQQSELDLRTGGNYWHWKASSGQFVPTYNDKSVRDKIHFSLLRTMWSNGKLASVGPTFYVHGGCEAMCPLGAAKFPYNVEGYSNHTQIAECLMYYGNGLALIGRAKVYFDIPTGFGDVFTPTQGNFGDILKEYFRIESANSKLAGSVASRNRTYFWSILGDWTLRMQY